MNSENGAIKVMVLTLENIGKKKVEGPRSGDQDSTVNVAGNGIKAILILPGSCIPDP